MKEKQMSDKELNGLMKKLMKHSDKEVKKQQVKREVEAKINDPLAGKSPEFRKMVTYAMLGSMFKEKGL
jgi:hypothetical protein